MSRISYLRKTPEGWTQSIRRMVSLNGLSLDPAEAREIVRYLSTRHGLAPEELRPALYEVERRHLTERPDMPEIVRETCTACHSLGRIATQRRTPEEWRLLTETHRGLYPLVDRQVFRRGSVPEEEGDFEFPVDAAVARLADTYPLHTPEWADWARNMRPARLAGTWAVRGYEIGRGPFFGTVVVEPVQGRTDEFTTNTQYVYPAEGTEVRRTGDGLVYTGYQWRGRSTGQGDEHAELREVMFVERDGDAMHGRWYTGAYDELGVDVRLERVDEGPLVLGAYPDRVRAGTETRLTLFGVDFPSTLGAADIDLGAGVEILDVSDVQAGRATVQVRVSADAAAGARDLLLPGARTGGAVVVYGTIDYVRVEPYRAVARTGGAAYAPGQARFEAVAYADGPDDRRDTEDDVRIGAVPATWSLIEYPRTYGDDDLAFVGSIDGRGRFTPALDGPNPERSGNRNNIGEVWVAAEHTPEGAEAGAAPLRARGFLVVSPPVYMDWDGQITTLQATEQDGGHR
jgi:quinohemoprotein amine dehydrogenase